MMLQVFRQFMYGLVGYAGKFNPEDEDSSIYPSTTNLIKAMDVRNP